MTPRYYTRNGHLLSDMSSLIQKAVRRGRTAEAIYAASEMESVNDIYMWVRILTTSGEDCFDCVTAPVWDFLQQYYDARDFRYAEEALSLLCRARKNRDADYLACNILNSRDRVELRSSCSIAAELSPYMTKNGHSIVTCAEVLVRSIRKADYATAGYAGNELYVRYPKAFWAMLIAQAQEISEPIAAEIRAQAEADDWQRQDKHATPILAAKALLILLKVVRHGDGIFRTIPYERMTLDEVLKQLTPFEIPEYVFDMHTEKGLALGRTVTDFLESEQKCLSPYEPGDFEGQPWARFLWLKEHGFWDPDRCTPRPSEELMTRINTDRDLLARLTDTVMIPLRAEHAVELAEKSFPETMHKLGE